MTALHPAASRLSGLWEEDYVLDIDPTSDFWACSRWRVAFFFTDSLSRKIPSSEAKSYRQHRALVTSRARRHPHLGGSAKGPAHQLITQVVEYIRHSAAKRVNGPAERGLFTEPTAMMTARGWTQFASRSLIIIQLFVGIQIREFRAHRIRHLRPR